MPCGIKDILRYDPQSGNFFYKKDGNNQFMKSGKLAGALDHKGYRKIKFNGKTLAAHRMVWWWERGTWPDQQIDHINGIKDDNRIENLRLATSYQNQWNVKKSSKKGKTSKYKGVCWERSCNKWRAYITINGKQKKLGVFSREEDAKQAYEREAVRLRGNFHNYG